MSEPYYLKPNVVFEPLVDRWYAWPHLISPATAARNLKNRHIKIAESFVKSPQIHAEVVRNPKLLGGPFMDHDVSNVHLVEKHLDHLRNHDELIAFSDAIDQLEELLREKATGYSLTPLYDEVPEILKGYVELVYDLNNRPTYRLFESLLYKSKFYQESAQSVALWLTENDDRPFVLSTPRLDDADVVHLETPFANKNIDRMSKAARTPIQEEEIEEIATGLNVKGKDRERFRDLFTTDAPVSYEHYDRDQVRMRYFGHACILVETKELSILVDPVISYYGYQSDVSRMSYEDLPDHIDYVLITHNHQDHILFETLLRLRHKIGKIIVPGNGNNSLQDPNVKRMLNAIGFENVMALSDLDNISHPDCTITGIPFLGEHSDLDIATKLCYHVQVQDFSMLFAADSCNISAEVYEHVQKLFPEIDVIFLGMECDGAPLTWLYGPLLSQEVPRAMDHSRRLCGSNFEQGKHLVDLFQPKEMYVYAMGQEPWLNYIMSLKYTEDSNPIIASNRLLEYCEKKEIIAERLFGEKEICYNTQQSIPELTAY